MNARAWLVGVLGVTATGAMGADFPEIEPNELKADATVVTLAPGDSLSGTSTGASTTTPGDASADTFRIKTVASPAGIYRYELVLTTAGTVGHTVTIRGLSQTAGGVINAGTDATAQTSFSRPDGSRVIAWYGFGRQEEMFVRVAGGAATTGAYAAMLSRTPVAVQGSTLSLAAGGEYTIRVTGGDPEIWVFDATTLAPVPDYNNDDTPTPFSLNSTLTRQFSAGRYYLVLSDYNLQTNLPSPADESGRGENVLDFPDSVAEQDREATYTATLEIHEGAITGPTVATGSYSKTQDFEVMFVEMTVGGGGGCPADLDDDGVFPGANPDGGVTIEDLLFFVAAFAEGDLAADLDNGTGTGTRDQGVTIDDLVYFVQHFGEGC